MLELKDTCSSWQGLQTNYLRKPKITAILLLMPSDQLTLNQQPSQDSRVMFQDKYLCKERQLHRMYTAESIITQQRTTHQELYTRLNISTKIQMKHFSTGKKHPHYLLMYKSNIHDQQLKKHQLHPLLVIITWCYVWHIKDSAAQVKYKLGSGKVSTSKPFSGAMETGPPIHFRL